MLHLISKFYHGSQLSRTKSKYHRIYLRCKCGSRQTSKQSNNASGFYHQYCLVSAQHRKPCQQSHECIATDSSNHGFKEHFKNGFEAVTRIDEIAATSATPRWQQIVLCHRGKPERSGALGGLSPHAENRVQTAKFDSRNSRSGSVNSLIRGWALWGLFCAN